MSSFLRTVLNSDGMEDWSEDKMELKEGMYVRTNQGIGTIHSMSGDIVYNVKFNKGHIKKYVNILKEPSFNILDLLEVGDVVVTNNLCGEITKIDKENDRIYTTSYEEEYCSSEDVKKVLTREQFGSVAYEIGGQN